MCRTYAYSSSDRLSLEPLLEPCELLLELENWKDFIFQLCKKDIAWVRHGSTFAGLVIVFDYYQLLEEDSAADVSSSVHKKI